MVDTYVETCYNDPNEKEIEMNKYVVTPDDDGNIFYYKYGSKCPILHREDGPAIECVDGTKFWYREGNLHREDGPAIERADGTKEWYLEDKLHREDGPAVECADGTKEWYLEGKQLSEKKFKRKLAGTCG